MPLASLLAPITAATVVNVFMVALLWRDHQRERATGRGLWWFWPIAVSYGLGLAAFAYFQGFTPIESGASVFLIAALAELFGAGIVYGILHALYFSRGQRRRDRAFAFVLAFGLLAGMVGAMFQAR